MHDNYCETIVKSMIKKAFLFPGQGSQYVGMGKKLCERYQAASDVFDEASEALREDMKKLCFESSLDELTLTQNAQPAILTVSKAMFEVFTKDIGVSADIMAGHSLGEISALTCSGAIEFSDAVKIVRKRGQFMQHAVEPGRGLMAAAMTRDIAHLEEICDAASTEDSIVKISNYNTGIQTVISGDKDAVMRAMDVLDKEKIKTTILNVSAPFHCPLMSKAADLLNEELKNYTFHNPNCIVLSNVSASPYPNKDAISDYLTRQLVMPVQWVNSMKYLKRAMVRYGIELGPKDALKKMMKKNISDIPVLAFDIEKDAEGAKNYIDSLYIPFLARAMGIAVATQNQNFDANAYKTGVVEPYNKIQQLQQKIEEENRKATKEEMLSALEMLKGILKTKGISEAEQSERFARLFNETGTEEIFAEYK